MVLHFSDPRGLTTLPERAYEAAGAERPLVRGLLAAHTVLQSLLGKGGARLFLFEEDFVGRLTLWAQPVSC